MQELARIGGWAYDVASETVSWTDEVYRIHEVSPHEYNPTAPSKTSSFYAPEDQGRIDKAFRLAVEEGRPTTRAAPGDRERPRDPGSNGRGNRSSRTAASLRIYGHIQDIPSARRPRRDQGAHDLLRQFFDANIIGTLVVRDSGATLEANDYFLKPHRRTREELERGEIDWRAITPPEWCPSAITRSVRCGHAGYDRTRGVPGPDGTRVPVLVAATSLSARAS